MVFKRLLCVLVLAVLLGACSGGTVVFEPTALPPDLTPQMYEHPSGAFSLLVPPNWSVFSQEGVSIANASFAPPDSDVPLVHVSVVNLGQAISAANVGDLMEQYQAQVRPDVGNYVESQRNSFGDGSWQITGLRRSPAGESQPLNTFIERAGSNLSVINVLLPLDATLRTQTQTIINTYTLHTENALPQAQLSALSSAAPVNIEVVDVTTWTTPQGIFYVTGEVANHGFGALAGVPVQATLLSEDGVIVAEAFDTVMGYVLQPGAFAPFSLRFGQGQPLNATDFEITLGGDDWEPAQSFEVVSANGLEWTDGTQYSQDGALFITGTITNISDDTVRNPRVVATVFDGTGQVIAAAFADAEAAILPPDAETDYTILISDRGGIAERYIVDVQAIPCDDGC